jgi:hypothetical protein
MMLMSVLGPSFLERRAREMVDGGGGALSSVAVQTIGLRRRLQCRCLLDILLRCFRCAIGERIVIFNTNLDKFRQKI